MRSGTYYIHIYLLQKQPKTQHFWKIGQTKLGKGYWRNVYRIQETLSALSLKVTYKYSTIFTENNVSHTIIIWNIFQRYSIPPQPLLVTFQNLWVKVAPLRRSRRHFDVGHENRLHHHQQPQQRRRRLLSRRPHHHHLLRRVEMG